jgi:chorismate mutase|tara:strand:+ start:20879 stop:21091 length:213 start_codon:yes stop_codon:yes gene_type:complete
MNKINEKYLSRMLEGAEQGITQIDQQIDQLNTQLTAMTEQRQDMVTAIAELKVLLKLDEEVVEETPETVS